MSEIFTIHQMVELTGLSEFTIRGWENRYSAFSPDRSETGRRQYSKKDIERALLLRELIKRGYKIGKIAPLKTQKLQSLFTDPKNENAASESQVEAVAKAQQLIGLQRWSELKDLVKDFKSSNPKRMIRDFFLPSLRALSLGVSEGVISVAQEHIFSSLLRERIYSTLSALEKREKRSRHRREVRFVLATPEGDYHEMGLLLAHLLIRSYGFTSLYLGPNTPARDLSETILRFDATHVLIVSTVSKRGGASQEFLSYLSRVKENIGAYTKILIAGAQVPSSQQHSSVFYTLADFGVFERFLDILDESSK